MRRPEPLPRAFFERPTEQVAPELVGKLFVRRRDDGTKLVCRLVEVEAYLGERDAASHARRGPTPRAAIMFGPPGRLYVYLIYGMHHCMNVVCERDGVAGAVLLRAAEPVAGFEATHELGHRQLSGPGRLCAGLDINRQHNGAVLVPRQRIYLADDGAPPPAIATSARVGVAYAGAWALAPLRFFARGHVAVSGKRGQKT